MAALLIRKVWLAMVFLAIWVALAVTITLIGKLIGSSAVLGIGAVMVLMTAMVDF